MPDIVALSEDYARFNLEPYAVREWENGARAGSYEWWHFDARLDDGAKIRVAFMNNDLGSPFLRVNVELRDGTMIGEVVGFPAAAWSAARGRTDVRMGPLNRLAGESPHEYRIQATAGGVSADFTLTGAMPAWRPATGHVVFGEHHDLEFNWLSAVPQGMVRGIYTIDGEQHETTGVGYHDHTWGNVALPRIVNDWYRLRGQAGPYLVVASLITSAERYGFAEIPVFMLASDGRIIGDNAAKMTFDRRHVYPDSKTGKPVANVVRYTYVDGQDRYVVTFERERDLSRAWLAKDLPWPKRAAARLTGFDGAHLRFAGVLTVEHYESSRLVDKFTDDATWDLMYFGHARTP